MECHQGAGDPVNSFALVSYIPDPLGEFLDRVRRELVSSCFAQSHVTILPPRTLSSPKDLIHQQLSDSLQNFSPFSIELRGVEVFESTHVVYLGLGTGVDELKRMHAGLNSRCLEYAESHQYHPHVTLAQDFPPQEMDDLLRLAKDRWSTYRYRRAFEVERLTFVQNTTTNRWLDLAEFPLADAVLTPVR